MAYESDHTVFMREWLAKNPQEVDKKKSGRAFWWDKEPIDEDARARLAAMRVPRKAYYYDVN